MACALKDSFAASRHILFMFRFFLSITKRLTQALCLNHELSPPPIGVGREEKEVYDAVYSSLYMGTSYHASSCPGAEPPYK